MRIMRNYLIWAICLANKYCLIISYWHFNFLIDRQVVSLISDLVFMRQDEIWIPIDCPRFKCIREELKSQNSKPTLMLRIALDFQILYQIVIRILFQILISLLFTPAVDQTHFCLIMKNMTNFHLFISSHKILWWLYGLWLRYFG